MFHRCPDVPYLKNLIVCNYYTDVKKAHVLPSFSAGIVEDTDDFWLESCYH